VEEKCYWIVGRGLMASYIFYIVVTIISAYQRHLSICTASLLMHNIPIVLQRLFYKLQYNDINVSIKGFKILWMEYVWFICVAWCTEVEPRVFTEIRRHKWRGLPWRIKYNSYLRGTIWTTWLYKCRLWSYMKWGYCKGSIISILWYVDVIYWVSSYLFDVIITPVSSSKQPTIHLIILLDG